MKYLDSLALARLRSLTLELGRLSAEGRDSGRHRSLVRGFSHEFSQHRAYAPGDELKALDWKLYARLDRFYIREYHQESTLTAHVLLDSSGSMGFPSPEAPKWDLACRLAMALAYLVVARGDAAGLSLFDREGGERLPPASTLSQLELMDALLCRNAPRGPTGLGGVLQAAASRARRRSLIIVISDFLGEPEPVLSVLRALKARKHELVALQVLHPAERDFPFEGPAVFEGLEGEAPLSCDAGLLGEAYRREFDRVLRLYESGCHSAAIPFGRFYTDRPWDEGLKHFLGRWA